MTLTDALSPRAVSIRPYSPADSSERDAVYEICLLTGDSGADASETYDEGSLLGHVWAGPYLALEPELAFVLVDDRGVAGYVLGAGDTRAFEARCEAEWWPPLRERYARPPQDASDRTPDQSVVALLWEPPTAPEEVLVDYPSHLHIDLHPRAQGHGHGRPLLERLLVALVEAGSPGVHLGVSSGNTRAQRFYRRFGFTELSGDDGGVLMGLRLG